MDWAKGNVHMKISLPFIISQEKASLFLLNDPASLHCLAFPKWCYMYFLILFSPNTMRQIFLWFTKRWVCVNCPTLLKKTIVHWVKSIVYPGSYCMFINSYRRGIIIIILQVRQLKLKEMKWYVSDQPAPQYCNCDLHSHSFHSSSSPLEISGKEVTFQHKTACYKHESVSVPH